MEGGYPAAHLGFFRIASYLKNRGFEADVADLELDELDDYLERIREGDYAIVGFSVSTYEMEKDLDLIWACKEAASKLPFRCLMIAGGQQAAMNTRQWLEEGGIDICVLGYGERPMLALCQQIDANPAASISEICKGISGTAYLDEARKLVFNPQPAITQEEFDILNYDCMLEANIPYEKFWAYNEKKISSLEFNKLVFRIKNIRIYATSHCPLRCAFCSSQYFLPAAQNSKAQKIVMLSAEKIHQLVLAFHKRYGADSFFFGCDNFVIAKQGRDRLSRLCTLLIESKKKGELPEEVVFHCMARVDSFITAHEGKRVIDYDLLNAMKAAGFVNISSGVETFSDRLLHVPSVNKINISRKDCTDVLDAILAAGLVPQILLILAIPESTPDEMLDTMMTAARFIREGAQVGCTTYMFADYGAPITSNPQYSFDRREWKNPYTGEIVKINNKVHPLDPVVASVIDKFETATDEEILRLRADTRWSTGILPKFFVGLASFIAIAKLLKRDDAVAYFEDIFNQLCQKNSLEGAQSQEQTVIRS
ncbi:hypothetical protein WV31_12940 [Magnetospirillum sp. ME-1]|nr:hypothetical protein WV31_12940 [Magnetospirillum sp. ME-1]